VKRVRFPRRLLAKMVHDALPGFSLLAVRGVPAGSSAVARELIVSSTSGERRRLILRCFTVGWQGSPRSKVERERLALSTLAGSGLPIPQGAWFDPQGRLLGHPAILQTLLPGRVVASGSAPPWGEGNGSGARSDSFIAQAVRTASCAQLGPVDHWKRTIAGRMEPSPPSACH